MIEFDACLVLGHTQSKMQSVSKWDTFYSSGEDFISVRSNEIEVYSQLDIRKNSRCLDIGCGTGQLTRELYHMGFAPFGIDLSPVAIDLARARTVRDISYLACDLASLASANTALGGYSLVTCRMVLPFLSDAELEFVWNWALSPDGYFVVTLPTQAVASSAKASMSDADVRSKIPQSYTIKRIEDQRLVHYICSLSKS